MTIKKTKIINIYAFVMVMCILLSSEAIYEHVYLWWDNTFKLIVAFLGLLSILIIPKRRLINTISFSLMLFLIMLLWTVGGANINMVTTSVVKLVPVLLFTAAMNSKNISLHEVLYKCLFFCICISIAFFVLFDLNILGIEPTRYIWELQDGYQYIYTNYLGVYFRWHRTRSVLGTLMISANGLWHEPGAYQIYANLGLFYSLFMFCKSRRSMFKAVVFSIAVITSTSTMGLLLMVLLWFFYYAKNISPIKVITIGVVFAASCIFAVQLLSEKMLTANWLDRTNNISTLLSLFLKSPIFGYDVGDMSIYSGILSYLVIYGVLGILPIYIFFKGIINNSFGNNVTAKTAISFWYVLCMMNENYAYFNIIFLIYGICIFYKKGDAVCL